MNTAPASFITVLEYELGLLEERLQQAIPMAHSTIGDRLRELVLAGGKRLRPSLILLTGRLYQAELERSLSAAAGIELLHTATLIHDDLVDNALERRGAQTLNAVMPMGLVVLSGDLLFAEAARLVAEAEHVGVVSSFARALSEICHGELLQAQAKHTITSKDDYFKRIYGKTASLFRTATEIGAMLGSQDDNQIAAMSDYGRYLGMAFQIVDDALDFSSDTSQLGKPGGHDLREGVISLPVILFNAQHKNLNGSFKQVIAGKASEAEVLALIEDIRSSGVIDEALTIAQNYAQQARDILVNVPADNGVRDILAELTYFTVNRNH